VVQVQDDEFVVNGIVTDIPVRKVVLFGESDHVTNRPLTNSLKAMFLRRGAHIMGEGIMPNEHQTDLDTENDGFRTDLLIASLSSKMVPVEPDRRERKLKNLLFAILKNERTPSILEPAVMTAWQDLRSNRCTMMDVFSRSDISTFVQNWGDNFQSIYDHYFPRATEDYYEDMCRLLSLTGADARQVNIQGSRHSRFGKSYENITQLAREPGMIRNIDECIKRLEDNDHGNEAKIVVFTGLKHLDVLHYACLQKYDTQCYTITRNNEILERETSREREREERERERRERERERREREDREDRERERERERRERERREREEIERESDVEKKRSAVSRARRLQNEWNHLNQNLRKTYVALKSTKPALTEAQHASISMISFPDYDEQTMNTSDVTVVFSLDVTIRGKPTELTVTVIFPLLYPLVNWDVSVSRVEHSAVYKDGTLYRIRLYGEAGNYLPTSRSDDRDKWSPVYDLAYLIRAIFARLDDPESRAHDK
jgi:ubiquitin-protein ligase